MEKYGHTSVFGQEDKGEIRGQSRTGSKAEGHLILEGLQLCKKFTSELKIIYVFPGFCDVFYKKRC